MSSAHGSFVLEQIADGRHDAGNGDSGKGGLRRRAISFGAGLVTHRESAMLMAPEEIAQALRQAGISGISTVMRAEVPGNVGYVFLREGEVVHATTLELEGEDALRAILRWRKASLAFCERHWPEGRSVKRPWTELDSCPFSDAPLEDAAVDSWRAPS